MSTGQIMLAVWPLAVLVLFRCLPAHRALIGSLLGGWLLLPPTSLEVAGLSFGKVDVERLSMLVGVLLFRRRALTGFRLRWFDLPAVLYCLMPLVSGLVNDLGLRPSLVQHYRECVHWLLPYLLTRALIRTPLHLREFGIAFAAAALLYAPLCLFEVKYGLKFSEWLAGSTTAQQSRGAGRGGTFRPTVLLRNGFVLTMMQGFGALLLIWLWFAKVRRRWGPIPLVLLAAFPLSVVVLAKSMGSIVLTVLGLGTLFLVHLTKLRVWLAALVLVVPLYMGVRLSGVVSSDMLVAPVAKLAPHKVKTFRFRLRTEDRVAERMREKPIFGFGDFGIWGQGKEPHLDGFWLFTVTRTGILSLALWAAFVLLPVTMFLYRTPARMWATEREGVAAVFAVFLTLLAIDALQNNYAAGPFIALIGALGSHSGERGPGLDGSAPGEPREGIGPGPG